MSRSMPSVLQRSKSRFLIGCVAAFALAGCSEGKSLDDDAEQFEEPSVQIGTPGGADGLDFVPLEPNGTLYVETFGQGGTHVLFAIRCNDLSNRAFVNITITNLETGVAVATPQTSRPQLLLCADERSCDLLPFLVMMGGLAEPGADRHGLRVRVDVEAHNVAGVRAETEIEGVLNTERLR
jgi:hypothetical protein